MPKITVEDNSKFIQTINTQACTNYYKNMAEHISARVDKLLMKDYFDYNANPVARENIEKIAYEFENDLFCNELLIIVRAIINIKKRILTDEEIYFIYIAYYENMILKNSFGFK